MDCISEQDLDEMNIEIIRNTLYKAYLEAFYKFCKEIGGTTADTMCEILAVLNFLKLIFYIINDNLSISFFFILFNPYTVCVCGYKSHF